MVGVLEGSRRGGLVEFGVNEGYNCAVLFEFVRETAPFVPVVDSVSYTHLTLPTIYSV